MYRALWLFVCLLVPTWSWAAIAFVGKNQAEAEAGAAPTLNYTFGSGSNKIAIVVRCIRENAGAVSADTAVPTLGGNNTTQIGTGISHSGGVMRAEMYYYLNPSSGSQAIVSFPAATTDRNMTAVLEYTGVAQTSTFGTPTTLQATAIEVTLSGIASAVGETVIAGACSRSGTGAITASPDGTAPTSTERVDTAHSNSSTSLSIHAYEEAGAVTSTDIRIDLSESVQHAGIGVAMREAAASTDIGFYHRRDEP